jgi:hypothetical protein
MVLCDRCGTRMPAVRSTIEAKIGRAYRCGSRGCLHAVQLACMDTPLGVPRELEQAAPLA